MAYTDPRFRPLRPPADDTPGPGAYAPASVPFRQVRPRSAPGTRGGGGGEEEGDAAPFVKPTVASARRTAVARREAIRAVITLRPSYKLDVDDEGGDGYGGMLGGGAPPPTPAHPAGCDGGMLTTVGARRGGARE